MTTLDSVSGAASDAHDQPKLTRVVPSVHRLIFDAAAQGWETGPVAAIAGEERRRELVFVFAPERSGYYV